MSIQAHRLLPVTAPGSEGARARQRPAKRRSLGASPVAARPRTTVTTSPGRRARRGFHARFMVLSAIVVTGLVAGVGSLSAMLVEVSFRVEELRARIAESTQRAESLTSDVAELSSPFRIAAWAEGHGMVTPDDVVALTVEAGSGG